MTTVAERPQNPAPVADAPSTRQSGLQPFDSHTKALRFAAMLRSRDRKASRDLDTLLQLQGCPDQNGVLTDEQAMIVARMARRFDREGDGAAHDVARAALEASGLDLDLVRPHTLAESIQADREGRRMREIKEILAADNPK